MIKLSRKELKADDTFSQLVDLLVQRHQPADHTVRILKENRDIEDFCETSEHFVTSASFYISYECTSWLKDEHILVKIEAVTIYDDWNEYYSNLLPSMHGSNISSYPQQN